MIQYQFLVPIEKQDAVNKNYNRVSCIKINFSISRNVIGNDINYPFQIAIKYKSKHQGKYGASLQGQKYNMDNMVKLKHWPNVFLFQDPVPSNLACKCTKKRKRQTVK
jgi:hypothetical protein